MFWSETLKKNSKFCICHGAWAAFRIIHIEVIDALLEVYVTPCDGNRSLLCSLRRGEQYPSRLSHDLKFKPFQHVKFEIEGGEITLVGESYDGGRRTKHITRFLPSCPFSDEEDWWKEKITNGEDNTKIQKNDGVQDGSNNIKNKTYDSNGKLDIRTLFDM